MIRYGEQVVPGGFLIVIEGIDGAGKTTQADCLYGELCSRGLDVSRSKEPTNGQYGTLLRESSQNGRLDLETELELFLKDRREHVESLIRPTLDRDAIVILDRYYLSSIAYQGCHGGDEAEIRRLNEEFAPIPDLAIILDVDPKIGVARICNRDGQQNHFEDEAYLRCCRESFKRMPSKKVVIVDSSQSIEAISKEILTLFSRYAANKIAKAGGFTGENVEKTRLLVYGAD